MLLLISVYIHVSAARATSETPMIKKDNVVIFLNLEKCISNLV
jgi:hypothetical protein